MSKKIDAETRDIIRAFVVESIEALDDNEPHINELGPEYDGDVVNSIFRVFHTVKGSAGFLGFGVLQDLMHKAETLLDLIRKQETGADDEVIDLVYELFDELRRLLNIIDEKLTDEPGREGAAPFHDTLEAHIARVRGEDAVDEQEAGSKRNQSTMHSVDLPAATAAGNDALEGAAETVADLQELLDSAAEDADAIHRALLLLGGLRADAESCDASTLVQLCDDVTAFLEEFEDDPASLTGPVLHVVQENVEIIADHVDSLLGTAAVPSDGGAQADDVEEGPYAKPPTDSDDRPSPQKAPASVSNTSAAERAAATQKTGSTAQSIRVDTDKLDTLFNLVGELMTIETMVRHSPDLAGRQLPEFTKRAGMLSKICGELQEVTLSIRMKPIEGLFNKMHRLVRDLSKRSEKPVELEIFGKDTELDKNLIDEIGDPLVHLLRNSIDHGIENPEERAAKGKSEKGLIRLGAQYAGGEILITVEDDGAGLDRKTILDKARSKNLLTKAPEEMSDRDVWNLLFEPGFSTAKQVTEISGRGVGLDVVKRNLEQLRGGVQIDSRPGEGTRFTMRLPLTLAITNMMLVRSGEARYGIPLLSIRESFRPDPESVSVTMDGLELVRVRDQVLPVVRLHELFDVPPDTTELHKGILIIVRSRHREACLFVDEIIGQQQAVMKGLSDYVGDVRGVTGCIVLGDGGISLTLDVGRLVDLAEATDGDTRQAA